MARWRAWLAAAMLGGIVVAAVRHRADLGRAARDLAAVSPAWTVVLGLLILSSVLASGVAVRCVTPGLSVTQGIMVHQATTAANNAVIGSGPVNLGLRIAMLRSWGINGSTIALTVVVLNVVAAYGTWLSALLVGVLGLTGTARAALDDEVFMIGSVIAVAIIAASTIWWWIVLRLPAFGDRAALHAQRVTRRLRWRGRPTPVPDLLAMARTMRTDACRLIDDRGWSIALATAVQQSLVLLMPVAVVRATGIDASVISTGAVVVAFGVAITHRADGRHRPRPSR